MMERRHLSYGINVDVATTEDEWQQGLSGITEWGDLDGMLFEFPVSKRWPVYMREMSCSLNVYWLSETGHVIATSWMPKDATVYCLPIIEARYIIETRMPMAEWQLGDHIDLRPYEPTGYADAHSGEAERIHDESSILEL